MCTQKPAPCDAERPEPKTSGPTVLAIGRVTADVVEHFRASKASIVSCGLAALELDLLDRVKPDLICCQLMGQRIDASQVLGQLAKLNFTGSVVVFAPPLPQRAMVLSELQAMAPNIALSLIDDPLA